MIKYEEFLKNFEGKILEFNFIYERLNNQVNWLVTHSDEEVRWRGEEIQQHIKWINNFLGTTKEALEGLHYQNSMEKSKIALDGRSYYNSNMHLEYLLSNLVDINKLIDSFGDRASMIKTNLEARKQQLLKEIAEIHKHQHIK